MEELSNDGCGEAVEAGGERKYKGTWPLSSKCKLRYNILHQNTIYKLINILVCASRQQTPGLEQDCMHASCNSGKAFH